MAGVYTLLATAVVVFLQLYLINGQECKNSKEIVIALDASASVEKLFDDEKQFTRELLEQLRSETNAKFTLLAFNNTVNPIAAPGNLLTVDQLIEARNAYRLSGGETRTALVLENLVTYLGGIPTATFGAAVILTDGYSDDKQLTNVAAGDLRNLGKAKVFSVNVGNNVDATEMQLLASDISRASVSNAAKVKQLLIADCKEHCLDVAGIHTTTKVACAGTSICGIDYDSYGPNCYAPIVITGVNCSSSVDTTTHACNNAIDGHLFGGSITEQNCWASAMSKAVHSLVIDLGGEYIVRSVRIYGRDDVHHSQTGVFEIRVGSFVNSFYGPPSICSSYNGTFSKGQQYTAYCRATGEQVKVTRTDLNEYFAICEIKVNGFPTGAERCEDFTGIHTTSRVSCARQAGCGIDYASYGPECYDPIAITGVICSSSADTTTHACDNAIDGQLYGESITEQNCWASNLFLFEQYLVVDLGGEHIVRSVRIYSRDDQFSDQTSNFTISVGTFDNAASSQLAALCGAYNGSLSHGQQYTAYCRAIGHQVKVARKESHAYFYFAICEIKVNGFPA